MALPGWIFIEFDFPGFFENLKRKIKLYIKMARITGNLHAHPVLL